MSKGRFGEYGGQYVPETLMNAVHEVEEAYEKYKNDPEFNRELDDLLKNYAGRPSLLYEAKKMTRDLGGAKIYLKQQRFRSGASGKENGENPCHCRDRSWTARRGNSDSSSTDGYGM